MNGSDVFFEFETGASFYKHELKHLMI